MTEVGVVIIGRNEGARLIAAIDSVRLNAPEGTLVVYVDSGSSDGSVAAALAAGCEVVELDVAVPFTAARARNAGANRCRATQDPPSFLFFMDGDCRLCPTFIDSALAHFHDHPNIDVVCGRRREIRARRNVYHRLADMEWNTPIGPALACGGDALYRAATFFAVGGFDPNIAAGEEPELCVRLRAAGHAIYRIDSDMTFHDVDMTRFSQWWRRSARAGQAFAQGAWMHGSGSQRHWLRPALRVWFWTAVPVVAIVAAWPTRGWSLLLLMLFLFPLCRAYQSRRRLDDPRGDSALYAMACIISKFAELFGQIRFLRSLFLSHGRTSIVEYKTQPVPKAPLSSP